MITKKDKSTKEMFKKRKLKYRKECSECGHLRCVNKIAANLYIFLVSKNGKLFNENIPKCLNFTLKIEFWLLVDKILQSICSILPSVLVNSFYF